MKVGYRIDEAWAIGATEICIQGGIHPHLPGTAYFDLAREVKKRQPDSHLRAVGPMEIVNPAARLGIPSQEFIQEARSAGFGHHPGGAAAEIPDDALRWLLIKDKLPAATWIEIVRTAHRLRIRNSSTRM